MQCAQALGWGDPLVEDHRRAVLEAACEFARLLTGIDRALRRTSTTVPSAATKEEVAAAFWSLLRVVDTYDRLDPPGDTALRAECRAIIGPWLYRGRFWNRSYQKPHGYAGDFRMMEWMYDLEHDLCEDPTQPGILNCLDYVYRTVHSVQSVWERRRWFAARLQGEHERCGGKLRVLDIACGGARYTRDFLSLQEDPSGVEITLVDQDAAAISFCRLFSLAPWPDQIRTLSVPASQLNEALPDAQFDVVISTGLLDYLDAEASRQLLAQMVRLTAPGGLIAISNFHPDDPSKNAKDWLTDWPLLYKDEATLKALFPSHVSVSTARSSNGSLVLAQARCLQKMPCTPQTPSRSQQSPAEQAGQ